MEKYQTLYRNRLINQADINRQTDRETVTEKNKQIVRKIDGREWLREEALNMINSGLERLRETVKKRQRSHVTTTMTCWQLIHVYTPTPSKRSKEKKTKRLEEIIFKISYDMPRQTSSRRNCLLRVKNQICINVNFINKNIFAIGKRKYLETFDIKYLSVNYKDFRGTCKHHKSEKLRIK